MSFVFPLVRGKNASSTLYNIVEMKGEKAVKAVCSLSRYHSASFLDHPNGIFALNCERANATPLVLVSVQALSGVLQQQPPIPLQV